MLLIKRLGDKEIGRALGRRFYIVKTDEWDSYSNNLNNTRSRQFTQNNVKNVNDVLADTIVSQNQEIKNLKTDMLNLYSRLNKLTNTVNKNNDAIEERLLGFSQAVCTRLDYLTQFLDYLTGITKK